MNKFTHGNLSELANYTMPCYCGNTHITSYQNIVFANSALTSALDIVKGIMPQGKILIIADSDTEEKLLLGTEKILKEAGYMIITHMRQNDNPITMQECAELFNYPEDLRLVISVGGDNTINMGRYFSFANSLKHVVVCGDYSCVSAFSSKSDLLVNGILSSLETACSHSIIYDLDFLLSPSRQQIANLFGYVSSHYMREFDAFFSHCVNNERYCENARNILDIVFSRVVEASSGLVRGDLQSVMSLLECGIRVMITMQAFYDSSRNTSCQSVSKMLQNLQIHNKITARHIGELLFFSAKKLVKIYELFIKSQIRDLGFPPDKSLRTDKIFQLFGGNKADILQNIDYDESGQKYGIRLLRLEEYRKDLLEMLNVQGEKITTSAKTFRRLSSDLGYSLQKSFSVQDVKYAISLAPDFEKDFYLLALIRDMGLLDSYLA